MALSRAPLVICLLLVTFMAAKLAQIPPPTMPNTFQASGEVEFNWTEGNIKGKFVIARDQMKQMGYEWEEFESGRGDITEAIFRYDMNKTYYIRGQMFEAFDCNIEQKNYGEMPEFWNWLSRSSYLGTANLSDAAYDVWGTNIGGTRFEFGKPRSHATIQYFYRQNSAIGFIFYSVMKYNVTPDASLFNVPDYCYTKK